MSKGKKTPTPGPNAAIEAPFDDVLGPRTSAEYAVGDPTDIDELSGLEDPHEEPPEIPSELTLDEPPRGPHGSRAPNGYLTSGEYTPPTGSNAFPPFPVHPSQPSIPVYGYAPTGPQRISATAAAVVLGIGSMLLTASGLYAWDAGLFSSSPKPAPVVVAAPAPAPSLPPPEVPKFEPTVGPVRFTVVEDGTLSGIKGLERGLFEGTELGLNSGTLAKLSEAHGGGSFVGALWLTAMDVKTESGKSAANASCKMALTPDIGVEGTRNQEASASYEAEAADMTALTYLAAQACGQALIANLDTELSKPAEPEPAVEPSVVSAAPPPKEKPKKKKKKKRRRRSRRSTKR